MNLDVFHVEASRGHMLQDGLNTQAVVVPPLDVDGAWAEWQDIQSGNGGREECSSHTGYWLRWLYRQPTQRR